MQNQSVDQFKQLYDQLVKLAGETLNPENGNADKSSWIFQTYDLSTKSGKWFYQALKDEQLLDVLKKRAKELEYSPAQKEVFWVWRVYLKQRFKRWPYALEAAGLARSAGKNGKSLEQIEAEKRHYKELLEVVRGEAQKKCRIPHPQELPQLCCEISKYKRNWNEVIQDAGLNADFFQAGSIRKIENLEKQYLEKLETIVCLAKNLGRAPMKTEVEKEVREALIQRCGSWRNVLYQIDLEPVRKIAPFSSTNLKAADKGRHRNHSLKLSDCYYRILNPDQKTVEDLTSLYKIKQKLGHVPDKKEVEPELRKRLQDSCGSWANALYQLEAGFCSSRDKI